MYRHALNQISPRSVTDVRLSFFYVRQIIEFAMSKLHAPAFSLSSDRSHKRVSLVIKSCCSDCGKRMHKAQSITVRVSLCWWSYCNLHRASAFWLGVISSHKYYRLMLSLQSQNSSFFCVNTMWSVSFGMHTAQHRENDGSNYSICAIPFQRTPVSLQSTNSGGFVNAAQHWTLESPQSSSVPCNLVTVI